MKKVFRAELFRTMTQLAVASFSLIAALAWNSAIQTLIQRFIEPGSGLKSQFIYAIIVTVIAVLVAYSLSRFSTESSDAK